MRFGQHWDGYPPDDPPEGRGWCSRCEAWECECEEELDKVEATCQWFDEQGFPVAGANPTGGGKFPLRVQAAPEPLQLDYPVWRMSFSEYAAYKGWEMP